MNCMSASVSGRTVSGYFGPFAAEPATSWAAPHLAGIAARLLSLRPGLKPFEVKTLLYWMSLANADAAPRVPCLPCNSPAREAEPGRQPRMKRTESGG